MNYEPAIITLTKFARGGGFAPQIGFFRCSWLAIDKFYVLRVQSCGVDSSVFSVGTLRVTGSGGHPVKITETDANSRGAKRPARSPVWWGIRQSERDSG